MPDPALSGQCDIYGSQQCPCILSALEECLVCSHLQGQEFCSCNWSKYCVYINYIHEGKNLPESGDFLFPVRFLNVGGKGYHVYMTAPEHVIASSEPLTRIVLMSRQPPTKRFTAIVSGVYPDHGIVSFAVKPLTVTGGNSLFLSAAFDLTAAGPSVQGLNGLQELKGKSIIIAAGGFGQLLVYSLAQKLLRNNIGEVIAVLEDNIPIIANKLEKSGVKFEISGKGLYKTLSKHNFHACYSLGDGSLHKRVSIALNSSGSVIPLYISSFDSMQAF